MDFDKSKKKYLDALYKPDNSKKGSVDKEIVPLIDKINKLDDFYTTSSCSGRITLFETPEKGRKDQGNWLIASHQQVKYEEVIKKLQNLSENVVWFRFESFILHVCARNLDAADKFLKLAKLAGYKRTGITNTTPRIMIELMGNLKLDAPIARNKTLLVSNDYIKHLVDLANQKMELNHERIKKLLQSL